MRSKFPTAHPSMGQFTEEIRSISCDYVRDLKAIELGNYTGPKHQPPYVPKIPFDYEGFGVVVEVSLVAKKKKPRQEMREYFYHL